MAHGSAVRSEGMDIGDVLRLLSGLQQELRACYIKIGTIFYFY